MSNINISEHSKLSYRPEHKLIKVSNGIQLDNVQRVREPGTFIPNWMSHSNPSPQGSGNPREEEGERFSDTKKTRFSKHSRTDTRMNSYRLRQHAQACVGLC